MDEENIKKIRKQNKEHANMIHKCAEFILAQINSGNPDKKACVNNIRGMMKFLQDLEKNIKKGLV